MDVSPQSVPLSEQGTLHRTVQARLAPYFYQRDRENRSAMPADQFRALRQAYVASLSRNLLTHQELLRLLSAFHKGRIPVLPLKGTPLALRLYGDLGARPTADLDLFVRYEDVPFASHTLETLGYAVVPPRQDPDGYDITFSRASETVFVFVVELHRSLGDLPPSARALPASVWERARPSVIDGVPCWLMDPTDELLYLCLHLAKHRFADPLYILDTHQAVITWGHAIAWPDLEERAIRHRLRSPVALALALSQRWFGTPVPVHVLDTLALPRWKRWYFNRVEWGGRARPHPVDLSHEGPLYTLFLLILDETWSDRLARLKKAFFPSPESLQAGGFGTGWGGRARRLLSRFGSLAAGLPRYFFSRPRATR